MRPLVRLELLPREEPLAALLALVVAHLEMLSLPVEDSFIKVERNHLKMFSNLPQTQD